jgi:ribokinase
MKRERFDVVGLGQCCIDYIAQVESYPVPDAKCEFKKLMIQGGGPVATALVALSRWGLSCSFSGVCGDDPFGPEIRKSLEDEGVDTRGLLVREGHESQFAFIVAEPGVGRRTVFWRRPTGPPPRLEEMNLGVLKAARAFHTDGLFIDASIAAAREAKRAGVPVVVDAGSLRDGMLELARSSDYFIASEKFARELTERGDPVEACRKLAALGPRVTGVTLGPKGHVASIDGRIIERSAVQVDAVDTTGCGDIFHAGMTYGIVKGWDAERSLDFGAWAAARSSTRLGGREGIPGATEIRSEGWLR